jgi:NAD(P)-dependent dehydrogenase (short-subunit alcohol dehydrogenase family)
VLRVQSSEQVECWVERPGDRVGQPLDVDAGGRLPLVREQRMKADEGGDDARRTAPALIELVEVLHRRLGTYRDRPAVAVGRDRVQPAWLAVDLAQDQREDDVAAVLREVEEQRPPALEQTGALDVAAEQVGVAAADPFQQRIPLLRRHLEEGRRPR